MLNDSRLKNISYSYEKVKAELSIFFDHSFQVQYKYRWIEKLYPYKRCMDDTLVLFDSELNSNDILDSFNSIQSSVSQFTERLNKFTYLGSCITPDGIIAEELPSRIH